jgi:transcriptional regulator with PAS, ATPase and Fis domain
VAFNAAAITESLAEAELFGARKGAYTGADRDRKGLFVEAHGGTLFIDEIASMSAALQGKLLRALEQKEVLPVGATTPIPVDVRIIAATNVDLQRLPTFRRDLYYRLSVVRIVIPPLRERPADIPLLAQLALERFPGKRLSAPARDLLQGYDWPGNVRELMNVIERSALLARTDEIGAADILFEDEAAVAIGAGELGYDEAKQRAISDFQRRYLERLLGENKGNISAASRQAGITRAALHRMLKRLGMSSDA